MTQLLSLVASELRKRAERANSTFSITDKTLVRKLNLDGRERMRVRYYISKIPDAEIWRDSPLKTTFILKSDIALRWCDFLANRGVGLKSECKSSAARQSHVASKSNKRLTQTERCVLEVIKGGMVRTDDLYNQLNLIGPRTIDSAISSLREKGLVKKIPDFTDMRRAFHILSEESASRPVFNVFRGSSP